MTRNNRILKLSIKLIIHLSKGMSDFIERLPFLLSKSLVLSKIKALFFLNAGSASIFYEKSKILKLFFLDFSGGEL